MKMKKWIVIFVMCTLITCTALTLSASASKPTVRLPSSIAYIHATYGALYWFDITLSGIAPGHDITNGIYPGWCVQKDMKMSDSDHPVYLISSYDFNNLSTGFQNIGQVNWNKINYIINHRQGTSRNDTQMAIWNITDNVDISTYNDSKALINDANQNGQNFTPTIGQKLAVPLVGRNTIQLAFLELTIPGFEGLVWKDTNKDGIQNSNELGMPGITVSLFQSNGNLSQTKTTNSQGIYSFENVLLGEYYLQFDRTAGYTFSPQNVGIDDTIDSDADSTGKTSIFTVITNNETITIWDAGMYLPESDVTPTPSQDVTPSHNINPTADVSAGEPYRGFINSTITFNGSASYDQDGRIVAYHWNFGDGTNGTGEITTHIYTASGDYNVSLLVRDEKSSQDIDTTIAHITSGNNPPSPPDISGPLSGNVNVSYQYAINSTDSNGDALSYVIDWGDGQNDTSPSVADGQSIVTAHQWNAPGFYEIQVYAQDPYNKSGISKLIVAIGVKFVGNLGYFIDQNGDSIFDQFHNNATGTETGVNQQTDGNYLIDSNGDGTYDLLYNAASGQTQPYSETPMLMYLTIILAILVIVFVLIFYLIRKRNRLQ